MKNPLLIRGARQLLTLGGVRGPRRGGAMRELGIVQDGAVLIVDGKIAEVGPSRRVERLAAAKHADEIEASGKVVMPAFVDCHTRLACAPAGCEDFAEASRMLSGFSQQRMEMEIRKRLRELVRHGTTTVLAGCGYGLDEATERKALRAIKVLNEGPIRLIPGFFGALQHGGPLAEQCVDEAAAMLGAVAAAREADAVAISASCPPAALDRFVSLALGHGLRVFLDSASGEPSSAIAAMLGLRDLPESQCARVAEWGVPLVLLPGQSYHRGDFAYAPARSLIDSGAAVALATGYDHLLSPTASMPMIASIACTQMKMTAAEAISACTVNAAWALGVAGSAGSLEIGKDADIVMTHTGDYRDVPLFFGQNPVAAVIHRGECIFPRVGPLE